MGFFFFGSTVLALKENIEDQLEIVCNPSAFPLARQQSLTNGKFLKLSVIKHLLWAFTTRNWSAVSPPYPWALHPHFQQTADRKY